MQKETILIIKEIAQKAGEILLKYRDKKLHVETKLDEFDFVTQADKESDAFVFAELQKHFSSDKILIEESKSTIKDYSGRVWMADPLDGTKHYIAGEDGFSVMIGLCVDGIPQLGVVYAPVREIFYWAEKGKGSYKQVGTSDIKKLQVSDVNVFGDSRVVVRRRIGEERSTDSFEGFLSVKEKIGESSTGLKICKVAEAEAEAVFCLNKRARKWDFCASEAILREAGGILTNLRGKTLDYFVSDKEFDSMTLGSNGLVHKEMLNIFSEWADTSEVDWRI